MALENGMDVKTLSDMIGHVSAETTLNIYSHITDTMRLQAAVKIDREIGGVDEPMPERRTSRPKPYQVKLTALSSRTSPKYENREWAVSP